MCVYVELLSVIYTHDSLNRPGAYCNSFPVVYDLTSDGLARYFSLRFDIIPNHRYDVI